jgi:hypothetical protein
MTVSMRKTVGIVVAVAMTAAGAIGVWAKSAPVTTNPETAATMLAATAAMNPLELMRTLNKDLPVANHGDPF